ncbi:MAG: type II secretion system F family protein [Blastocatellia bacterium]
MDKINNNLGRSIKTNVKQNINSSTSTNAINFSNLDKPFSIGQLIIFTETFADEFAAGIAINKILGTIADNSSNKRFATVIRIVQQKVEAGYTLSEALDNFPNTFPQFVRALFKSAEVSSNWTASKNEAGETTKPGVLDLLLVYLKRNEKIKIKLASAMIYPSVVLFFIIICSAIIAFMVLPGLREFFIGLGIEKNLNFATSTLLLVGDFITNYYYTIPVVLVGLGVGLILLWKARLNIMWQKHQFDVYLIGKILRKLTVAEIFSLFATLQEAGITPQQSLQIVANATRNIFVKEALVNTRAKLYEGKLLAESLKNSHSIFGGDTYQILHSAEETGKLSTRPLTYAQTLFSKAEVEIDNLMSVVPMAMLGVVGMVIAFIVIGVYSAFFGIIGTLSNHH